MNANPHIIIKGKQPFCSTLSELLVKLFDGKVYITPESVSKTMLINTKVHKPDAAILEDDMSECDLLAHELKEISSATTIILFSARNRSEFKNADYVFPPKITDWALRQLSAILIGKVNHAKKTIKILPDDITCSLRQLEVFEGIMLNKTNPQMAEDFSLSERTIETHRQNLYTKTGADNLIDLTLFGRKNNWIDEDGNLTEVFFELKKKAK